jgi:hypothetical protein
MFVNKSHVCILLIIILFILFYFTTKFNYSETFECAPGLDGPLKTYLALNGQDKDFVKGCKLPSTVPQCSAPDPSGSGSQFGTSWEVEYKDGPRNAVCVPEIYTDKNAYIPCNAPNPGPPDLTGCGIPEPNSDCIKEMEKVPSYIKYDDRQQYVYSCKNGICPCMWKYGKDYKMDCSQPLIGGCKGTQYGCCPDGITAKKNQEDICIDSPIIGGCEGTQYGCCPDGITSKNKKGNNCINSYEIYNGLFWTGCTPYQNRITDYENKQKFNKLCNRALRGSFYVQTNGMGCTQPQNTNIGCSLVPQKKLKTN